MSQCSGVGCDVGLDLGPLKGVCFSFGFVLVCFRFVSAPFPWCLFFPLPPSPFPLFSPSPISSSLSSLPHSQRARDSCSRKGVGSRLPNSIRPYRLRLDVATERTEWKKRTRPETTIPIHAQHSSIHPSVHPSTHKSIHSYLHHLQHLHPTIPIVPQSPPAK